ncbi:MAG: hypothetical protein RDV48_12685 [Candidatus Eremiobacteraeota bacterium]|nr:hypothetical protein [Candidatus Eremiobacteraeota bacterium]
MGKRIVIDTNVLISALGWSGAERALLMQCREGVFQDESAFLRHRGRKGVKGMGIGEAVAFFL